MRRDFLKQLLPFLLLILILNACTPVLTESDKKNGTTTQEDALASQTMPENMPDDFGFSVQFGMGKNNEINTFKSTVTKDLIVDGTATANIAFANEEMAEIYEKMRQVRISEMKNFIPEPVNGSICMIEPYEEDEWKIIVNGETITHSVSGIYCDPTSDAKQLVELRNFVFNKIKSKDDYKSLPDARGGYE